MFAVFVNCIAVIIGSLIGCVFARKITEGLSTVVTTAAGIITMVLGFQMAFKYESIICLSLSLILGGLIGTWINIDEAILRLGQLLERVLYRSNDKIHLDSTDTKKIKVGQKNFAYAFLNSSVLFCVGAMAILGSFKAGIEHDYTIIYTKSILDGFMAIVFTASMGIGTIFSFLSILLYQGLLTLLSSFIASYIDTSLLNELSACGGAMIVMIGLNLLNLKKIKTANFLPSLLVVVFYKGIISFLK